MYVCVDHAISMGAVGADVIRLLDEPTEGKENGGASADRWEAASAERPEARERRSRRKRGPAPDPEARPSEADRREASNVLGRPSDQRERRSAEWPGGGGGE